MLIHHKGIYHDRFDAPFIGTLIAATKCLGSCNGCFHQDRLDEPIQIESVESIMDKVSSVFSEGIILGYLEWLDSQYDEALSLIDTAMNKYNMKVILYTRHYKEYLLTHYPELFDYKGLYIKCGPYDRNNLDPLYTSYGVPLASRNQYIIQV